MRFALFGFALLMISLWLGFVWLNRSDPGSWYKDWYCFYAAGVGFLESGAAAAYHGQCHENYFWLYPPYVLYLYAALSTLPPLTAYGLVVTGILITTALGLVLLGHAVGEPPGYPTVAMFAVGSAAMLATIVAGQHSALLLVSISGAFLSFRQERPFIAGLFLGILGIKPNWAAIFVLWLMLSRRWRALTAMAVVGGLMIASTAPMGVTAWAVYLTETPRHLGVLLGTVDGEFTYPAHKLITIEAFARSTLGTVSAGLGRGGWIALQGLAVMSALIVWLRPSRLMDQLAMTVLIASTANIYVEFYDALVLVVPAAVWWVQRSRYTRREWALVGACALGIWLWQWIWALGSPGDTWPALVGGLASLWILVEGRRALRYAT